MDNKEAIAVLDDMKVKIAVPKSAVTQNKRNEALDLAINSLEEDRWIPVGERLPEKDKNVLVTDNEVDEAYITFYMGDGLWCCDDGVYEHRITHWKPLPKPYESEVN